MPGPSTVIPAPFEAEADADPFDIVMFLSSTSSVVVDSSVFVPCTTKLPVMVRSAKLVGLLLKSAYDPDVATVASVGVPVTSAYAPVVATVASVGVPVTSE